MRPHTRHSVWRRHFSGRRKLPSPYIFQNSLENLPTPVSLVAAREVDTIDHTDVKEFTEKVLTFWRKNGTKMPMWSKAARIVFSFVPSSGASECIFALVKNMFGADQVRRHRASPHTVHCAPPRASPLCAAVRSPPCPVHRTPPHTVHRAPLCATVCHCTPHAPLPTDHCARRHDPGGPHAALQ